MKSIKSEYFEEDENTDIKKEDHFEEKDIKNKELIATNMNSIKSEYVEEDDTKEDLPKEDSNNVNDTEDEMEYTHLCDICNKRFSSKNTRSKHVNCVHKEKRYPCRQC